MTTDTDSLRALARHFAAEDMLETAEELFEFASEIDRLREWRPIETAPKDGTEIILTGRYSRTAGPAIHNREYVMRVTTGYWSANRWQTGNFGMWEEPTHWKPLPEPPDLEEKA